MPSALTPPPGQRVDLTQCEREPIHLLGRVQSFGLLLAVTRGSGRISHASANAGAWCGREAAALIGLALHEVLPAPLVASIDGCRQRAEQASGASGQAASERLFGAEWPGRDTPVDLALHVDDGHLIVEFEPSEAVPQADALSRLASLSARLLGTHDEAALFELTVQAAAGLCGYQRVMLYRFSPDGSGRVVAEALAADTDSFLGLRFPASDIPAQARALYLRNRSRVIADVLDEGVPIVAAQGDATLDLSQSVLRSVSPVHLEYLRNMGTAASMSVSLVIDGRLWGLIACHHLSPLRPAAWRRHAMELLGGLCAAGIARVEQAALRDLEVALPHAGRLSPLLDADREPEAAAAAAVAGQLCHVWHADALVLLLDGQARSWPSDTPEPAVQALRDALEPHGAGGVFASSALGVDVPGTDTLAPRIAGVLALPISQPARDWLLLLRPEVPRDELWAGNPDKAVDASDGRLAPRKSFEAWRESVRGQSEPWSAREIALAEQLRVELLERLLTQRERREAQQLRRAGEQQRLLVRELNHRVRNMLGLIAGLIDQTQREAGDMETLAAKLEARVQAMGRAHTQIESVRWERAPLAQLLDVEVQALAGAGQVHVHGAAVDVDPDAYLSLALVLHELATNARKYGGLSGAQGHVDVDWHWAPCEDLVITWREHGGPATATPQRRGFGLRVIESAMAHELQGAAELEFGPGGLEARLTVPGRFVAAGRTIAPVPVAAARRPAGTGPLPARVLVVEDDLVIALLAESLLRDIGCRDVLGVGSATEALEALSRGHFDLALLDVNLGQDTSEAVAERLAALGVPWIVASGYSEADGLPPLLLGAPRVVKPYDRRALEAAVRQAMQPPT